MRRIAFPQYDSIDDGLIVEIYKDGSSDITITDDWHGDSETGFGALLKFSLTALQTQELVDFLTTKVS